MSFTMMIVTSMNLALIPFLVFLTRTSIATAFGNESSPVICHENERQALWNFKKDLEDLSNRLSSWTTEEDCCKWVGIVCNKKTGHVEMLHLSNLIPRVYSDMENIEEYQKAEEDFGRSQYLSGKLNPSLLNLTHMRYLDLSYNDFGGNEIPTFIGSLRNLRYLNLSNAGFEGLIPHQLGNLSNLHSLGLFSNHDLYVDNLEWLHGLSSLQHLDMSYVNLSKASDNWLSEINKLPLLLELRMSGCSLDRIPHLSYVNFTSISILDLSNNNFKSLIPKWIFNLNNLISLYLSVNEFEGPLPSGVWNNLTSLKSLDISDNSLNSSLPNSLGLFNLDGLVSLNLGGNGIPGPIPCGFQNLTALRDLDLSWNYFNSHPIPNCLYGFRSLETLTLHRNNLQGELSYDIANLTSLVVLDVSFNQLEGMIPTSIGNLCNLRKMSLSHNQFSGEVSKVFDSFSNCISPSLMWLELGFNLFSGPIPISIGKMSSLKFLHISNNKLNGTLPQTIGSLLSLERLNLGGNQLQGVVSETHLANLIKLNVLSAPANSLILSVGPNWIPPFQLGLLSLRSWLLGPPFPMWLQSQQRLNELDLSSTNISGTIPSWFWNFSSNLNYLNLSNNQLTGQIPKRLSFRRSLRMYLSSNQFNGPLPHLSSNILHLDLSKNLFSEGISHFLCHEMGPSKGILQVLHLGKNSLSGEIPSCWKNWPSLEFINLASNNLTGRIPNSMGDLVGLRSLHLRNNHLFGELPQSLQRCTKLEILSIGINELSGSVPTWIGNRLSHLTVLDLRSNKFNGRIPTEICQLASLHIIDVANNDLSGNIPQCLGNFNATTTRRNSSERVFSFSLSNEFISSELLENVNVVTKGNEFQYDTILGLVVSLDLSGNKLSGETPEEVTILLGLLSLNLSSNHLTGRIPHNIGDMKELESLDLSRNQLFGQIPQSMASLTFLGYLNLSENNLSGEIPSSTQLQSFDASSYVGNKLCGPPLTKNCSTGEKTATSGGYEEEKAKDWFHWGLAIGFAVGFGGICLSFVINKTWRCAYFGFVECMWIKLLIFYFRIKRTWFR